MIRNNLTQTCLGRPSERSVSEDKLAVTVSRLAIWYLAAASRVDGPKRRQWNYCFLPAESFWKRGSFRIGSSRSRAALRNTFAAQWTVIWYRKQFLQSSNGAARFAHLRGHAGEYLNCSGTFQYVFLDREYRSFLGCKGGDDLLEARIAA